MIQTRCSSLPLLAACSQAQHPPVTRIEGDDYLARLGSAFHDLIANEIAEGTRAPEYRQHVGDDDVDAASAAWNVKRDDLAPLFFWAKGQWRETLSVLFPCPVVEREFVVQSPALRLTGHADLMCYLPSLRQVRGLDWKTGYLDLDATEQIRGYARCALDHWPEAESVQFSILRVRDQRMVTMPVWSRVELDDWFGWLERRLAEDTYRPGDHCVRCPRVLECPARVQQMRSLISIADKGESLGRIEDMSPDELADTVLLLKSIEKWSKNNVAAAKAHVESLGGSYGDRLKIVEKPRQSIDLLRGCEVIEQRIETAGLLRAAKISKTAINDELKAIVPRGKAAGAMREMMGALAEAGALETTHSRNLEVKYRGNTGAAITSADNDNADEIS